MYRPKYVNSLEIKKQNLKNFIRPLHTTEVSTEFNTNTKQ